MLERDSRVQLSAVHRSIIEKIPDASFYGGYGAECCMIIKGIIDTSGKAEKFLLDENGEILDQYHRVGLEHQQELDRKKETDGVEERNVIRDIWVLLSGNADLSEEFPSDEIDIPRECGEFCVEDLVYVYTAASAKRFGSRLIYLNDTFDTFADNRLFCGEHNIEFVRF